MIIDCVADLHGHYPQLEGGDLLIVAGDWTAFDTPDQVLKFGIWLNEQNYKRKIVIAGNHDNMVQTTPRILGGMPDFVMTYLCDSGTEFGGLKIWGSPWTKTFHGMNPKCKAFTVDTEKELAEKWDLIPDDIDILITHSPPWGIHDLNAQRKRCGSMSLFRCVNRVMPKLHVFGHIHEAYAVQELDVFACLSAKEKTNNFKTTFANASHVNEHYEPVNKPIRVIL